MVILLLPSAIAVAFPVAVTTVVDLLRTMPQPVREERLAAVKFGICAVMLMVVLAGWVFPAANQQYRVVAMRALAGVTRVAAHGPAPGLREMSLVELSKDDSLNSALWVGRESWVSSRAESIRTEMAQRTALMILPIVLIWMRWHALLLPRGRWYSALPLVVSAPVTLALSYTLFAEARALADMLLAPRWSGPWLALAILMTAGLVRVTLARGIAARG